MTRSDPVIGAGEFVDYSNPPVYEVVCGVMFKSINTLLAPHLGLLWERFRSEYPKCQEVPLIMPIVETFEPATVTKELEITEVPPLPRVWFLDEAENILIQIQRDRFLHNWKEVKKGGKYPHFQKIFEMFRRQLSVFVSFLKDEKLGELQPLQYEVTYV
jgi:uncharacterized protein (TIGR04255 family)